MILPDDNPYIVKNIAMHLNSDPKLALDLGQPVPMLVDDRECILIRKDFFQQAQDDFSVAETYAAIENILSRDDDPGKES